MLTVGEIRVENLSYGCVTDNCSPELSFSLESDVPDTFLEHAQIRMGEWEKVGIRFQTGIVLGGLSLKPFTEYELQLTAWDNHGAVAEKTSAFRAGRLDLPWEAAWITDLQYHFPRKTSPAPMTFRRQFTIDKKLKSAYVTATALGIYELAINGRKVGNEYFAPGFTSYKKTLQYQFYDVTDYIRECNSITAVVGGGWAVGRFTYESKSRITVPRQAFLLELFLYYEDGTRQKIITDGSWQVTEEGNYLFGDFYDGETYDATVDIERIVWKDADIYKPPFAPRMAVHYGGHVTAHEELAPISSFQAESGEMIYDFGQNLAGVVSIKVNGKHGQKITIRHAETMSGGELYTKSLRTAKQTITYICRDGEQEYSPRLTYMGFRYIGVSGIGREDIKVSAIALYSDFQETGTFSCSDEGVNRLHENVRWGAKSNFVEIPTDCPQRDERQGWTGDAAVFAGTACYNFDMGRFWEKWLRDMRLEQGRGGGIPLVVPRHGSSTPVVATACWGDSCILVPWAEYLARGNTELLRRQYPAMKRFLKAAVRWASLSGPGRYKKRVWKWLFQFGDWCAPEGDIRDWMGKGREIATAYFANSCGIVARVAGILGEKEEQEYYAALREEICAAYFHEFTEGTGRLKREFQTAYVLPLAFGMAKGEVRDEMAAGLSRLVREKDYHLSTGFPGTPHLLFALSDNGYAEDAFALLLQDTCPSWLYGVRAGGTTFWEQWNAITPEGEVREPSLNHYAYGAVGDFLYRRIAGIEAIEGGYRRFAVRPLIGGGICHARGSVKTPYGLAASDWKVEGDDFRLTVRVPVSAVCEVCLPSGRKETVSSGVHSFCEKYQERA